MKVHSSGYVLKIPLLSFFSLADVDAPIIQDVTRIAQQQISLNLSRAPSTATSPGESSRSDTVPVEAWTTDLKEARKVDEFCASGCGCILVKGGPCSFQFSKEYYVSARANVAELSWNELNMAVMGQVMALTYSDVMKVNSTKHRHAPAERQKTTTLFHHQGHRVCRTTFLFLHNMGEYRLKTIKVKYLADGLVPRIHGHTGRIPHHSLVHKDVECIISFIIQYCDERNPSAWLGTWVQKRRYPDTAICHHQEICVENVPSHLYFSLRTGCSILDLLQGLETLPPTHCCCTAVDGSLLVSTKQHCNCS